MTSTTAPQSSRIGNAAIGAANYSGYAPAGYSARHLPTGPSTLRTALQLRKRPRLLAELQFSAVPCAVWPRLLARQQRHGHAHACGCRKDLGALDVRQARFLQGVQHSSSGQLAE